MAQTHDGAMKNLAKRAGVSLSELLRRMADSQKWCWRCKAFHARSEFGIDKSRYDGLNAACRASKNANQSRAYTPRPRVSRRGKLIAKTRDGDKRQARARVNRRVESGQIPHPSTLPCKDCGHVTGKDRIRHEYDHYKGYAAEHQFDVEPVCVPCHKARESKRGVLKRRRRA